MASGTVNGSNSSSDSANYAHNIGHDLDYFDMVNTLETTSLNSQKKSSLVGSTPFDPKKSKVTVQRPGEQKAYQCGPNLKKNKKTDSFGGGLRTTSTTLRQPHWPPLSIRAAITPLSKTPCPWRIGDMRVGGARRCRCAFSQPLELWPGRVLRTILRKCHAHKPRQTAEGVGHDSAKEISRCRDEGNAHLNLSRSQLHSLPTSIRDLSGHLRELFLYSNKLVSLPNEIGTLTQLESLLVQENSLTCLPDTLAECTRLRILDVRHNKLCEIPQVIYRLSSLTHLLLRFNRIRVVDRAIGRLKNLQVLSLRENKIRNLPSIPGVCELVQLTTLDVSHNHLEHLHEEIGQCKNLSGISLQHNELTSLPESIGELSLLERLGISPCPLIFGQNGRPEINMDHNQITKIPFGIFSRASNLAKLNMKDNQLASLPPDVKTWTSLVELNLGTNQLTKLPDDIDHLLNLERIPASIQELRKLRVLDLEENHLDCLPTEIGNLAELQRLVVQSNRLTVLPPSIGNLQNLVYLAIGENDLQSLTPAIGKLKSLETLYLNDNFNLHDLPSELAMCCGLQIMSIENCPLSKIPVEVVSAGPSLVIQYLRLQSSYGQV
ncbi:unnamed protein product [Mesocestoides corti]|uniref:Disease resistance R13L4/SHOC-2-like LRR domain-containing protein n=1 Tax=Mesocestoides corti TaxID=53468 RepID=A0A0R3UM72_MESCO|nr:unnamed protein product [Mesocestoides corti]